jgi:hypothetical protein
VSRALSGSEAVLPETRDKVLAAAKRLNYVRDRAAVRLKTGKTWVVNSHPVNVMVAYGFNKDEFAVGDRLHLLTWRHVRGINHLWPRAIQVNDGPLKSNLRYTDMIDIADGTFTALGITPAANLNGSSPQRSGAATVRRLREQGFLDSDGNMIWPLPGQ